MKLIYDNKNPLIRFGVDQIKLSLQHKGIYFVEKYSRSPMEMLRPVTGIIVHLLKVPHGSPEIEDQSFQIRRTEEVTIIESKGSRGLMYGCLEWAERISRGLLLEETDMIHQSPAMEIRGIKYNLPYAPYDTGDPFTANEGTCMDLNYWHAYIDMLALNRYNCLSLWSEHPFHLMVVSPKYRAANPYTDSQIEHHISLFRQLFRYARDRGIDVYIFTWNIRILPEVARGLGLPESVADYGDMDEIVSRFTLELARYRQQSEQIKDYFREMVLQLLITYPELKGLGTSASEWMVGGGAEREQWLVETYIEAIKQSGREIPFIHRTNAQNAGKEIKEMVQEQFDPAKFYLSWKYSNAHCYSHPRPQFESLWGGWDGVDLEQTQVLYTVRNDDVFTLRWFDPEYVREYVRGMMKPYVKGFYWGSDGYIWGNDFQHADEGHQVWSYDFERHLFQFQAWGRLSYNPEMEADVWTHLLEQQYGHVNAPLFSEGLQAASKIIPAVNRLFWINFDYQWHPESCLSQVTGFKTILDFVEAEPMPGAGTMGIKDFALAEHKGRLQEFGEGYVETPEDIINILRNCITNTGRVIAELQSTLGDFKEGHADCTLHDLQAWVELGSYYACKFGASMELNRYLLNGNEQHRDLAVSMLEEAYTHWEHLGMIWSRHNKPYYMARVKRTFGYPYYLDEVAADIEKARQFHSPEAPSI